MKNTDINLVRRVDKILPNSDGLISLLKKRKIRLYQGFDPTGRLHIGHGIGLKLLMEFANAGHDVIFLFGTGTVLVGDPSQRSDARKLITDAEIKKNINSWQSQVAPIVDFRKIMIKQNGDWLSKLTLKDIVHISSNVSATQLFKRESFQNRIKLGNTVWYHETMYPIFQGYDSVVMDVDLEVGGTDQEFNMLMGRELLKKMKQKEKYVITLPLIMGTDGKKMSASKGNCIWMDDEPDEMYGKLMSVSDDQIIPYLRLCTDVSMDDINRMEASIRNGDNPRSLKAQMAFEVTSIYHDADKARLASEHFDSTHKDKNMPEDVVEYELTTRQAMLVDLLVDTNLAKSSSEAKRLIDQGGVRVNGVKHGNTVIKIKSGDILQVGRRKFLKLRLQEESIS
jgi:tyrosyl-tRNA synthetase